MPGAPCGICSLIGVSPRRGVLHIPVGLYFHPHRHDTLTILTSLQAILVIQILIHTVRTHIRTHTRARAQIHIITGIDKACADCSTSVSVLFGVTTPVGMVIGMFVLDTRHQDNEALSSSRVPPGHHVTRLSYASAEMIVDNIVLEDVPRASVLRHCSEVGQRYCGSGRLTRRRGRRGGQESGSPKAGESGHCWCNSSACGRAYHSCDWFRRVKRKLFHV